MDKEWTLSLWNKYNEKNCTWESYYRIIIYPKILFEQKNAINKCTDFIKNHFTDGKKEKAFQFPEFIEEKCFNGMRAVHMTSLYLLGDYLYSIWGELLYKKVEDEKNLNIKSRGDWCSKERFFKYVWFLTCLYHDVTSNVEDNAEFIKIENNYFESGVVQLKSNTIYEHRCIDGKWFRPRFKYSTIANYYKYRKNSGKFDHGIIAGFMLYRKLKENFEEHTKGHNMEENMVYEDKENNLVWSLEQLDIFAYISDAIICHNLWMAYNSCKVEEYKKNGLAELIVNSDGSNRLSIEEYPLQFMLCLLDTIEPIKRFCNESSGMEYEACLKGISIEDVSKSALNTCRSIKISWRDEIKNNPAFNTWLESIYELPKWMKINISNCQNDEDGCCVMISFKT